MSVADAMGAITAGAPTLESLCADLGGDLLTVLVAPRGTDRPVATPVIHARGEPSTAGSGDLVLAVGVADDDEAIALIDTAAAAGAVAVVLKRRDGVEALGPAADGAGIALVLTSADIAWGQLFALVRTATAAPRRHSGREVNTGPIGDLFVLADAIAAAAGGPVTIEDPQSRVLAFSNVGGPIDAARAATILGRQVPENWRRRLLEAGVFDRLRASDDVVRVEFPETADRRAIAVRGGGSLIASIWVSQGERPLTGATDAVLAESARIAAVHLLRHQAADDLDRRLRGELLGSALRGQADIGQLARELAVPVDAAVAVVAVQVAELGEPQHATALTDERLVSSLAVYFQAFRRKVSVAALDGCVYVLVVGHADGVRERFVALTADAVASATAALGVPLRAGIGTTVGSLAAIPASRTQADLALRTAAPGAVADIEEAQGEALLLELRDLVAATPRPLSRPLRRLLEHDERQATAYLPTLRAWLDSVGDPARVATALHVHPNTVRYRMRRIQELTGVDLHDPAQRFPLELQLRLERP